MYEAIIDNLEIDAICSFTLTGCPGALNRVEMFCLLPFVIRPRDKSIADKIPTYTQVFEFKPNKLIYSEVNTKGMYKCDIQVIQTQSMNIIVRQ